MSPVSGDIQLSLNSGNRILVSASNVRFRSYSLLLASKERREKLFFFQPSLRAIFQTDLIRPAIELQCIEEGSQQVLMPALDRMGDLNKLVEAPPDWPSLPHGVQRVKQRREAWSIVWPNRQNDSALSELLPQLIPRVSVVTIWAQRAERRIVTLRVIFYPSNAPLWNPTKVRGETHDDRSIRAPRPTDPR
jgi:hypothetical protein